MKAVYLKVHDLILYNKTKNCSKSLGKNYSGLENLAIDKITKFLFNIEFKTSVDSDLYKYSLSNVCVCTTCMLAIFGQHHCRLVAKTQYLLPNSLSANTKKNKINLSTISGTNCQGFCSRNGSNFPRCCQMYAMLL